MSSIVVTPTHPPVPATSEREGRVEGRAPHRWWVAVSSRLYLPACALLVAAVALVAVGWAMSWGGASFSGSLASLRVVLVGPLTLLALGVFLVVERLRPAQRRPLVARGHRHDVLYTVLNATLVAPLVTALTLSFVAVARDAAPWIVLPRLGVLPRWGAVLLILLAMDACNWFVHLVNHRARVLWRFHELHHSQEDMSVLTVFRTHPLIHVSYLLALLPATVLLANGVMSTTLLAGYAAMVAFAHSNTRLGFGPLERIFVSPNYHRIHHMAHGPQDVNMGFALTIWDQLFGTAVFPTPDTIRADTGLPGRPLAVEQASGGHLAVFARQLVGPFRPMRTQTDLPPVRSRRRSEHTGGVPSDPDPTAVPALAGAVPEPCEVAR